MSEHCIVLDGGTGRELKRIGAPFKQPEWSALALIEAPEYVARVHAAFIDAGADAVTTNSYAIVPFHIGAERFERSGAALADLSGRLARAAAADAQRHVLVGGSLPPICGSYRAEWFDADFARPILRTLVEALRPHIDYWHAETLSSIAEAELVREVIGQDGKPLWLSFTLRDDPDAMHATPSLRSGQTATDAAAAAVRLGARALLFNCSQPEVMGAALSASHAVLPQLLLGVYANAFAAVRKDAKANAELLEIRADLTPAGYLRWIEDWMGRGARIVGGCCGIGPEHIRAIRGSLGTRGNHRAT